MSDITDIDTIRKEVDRQKRLRCNVDYLESKIVIDSKILVGLESQLKGYIDSVADTKRRILDNSTSLEKMTKLLTIKPDAEKVVENAERIAARIAKLTRQIEQLTAAKDSLLQE